MDKAAANSLYTRGKYQEAVQAYTGLLIQKPDSPDLLSNRAACLVNLNKFTEALLDCDAALDLGIAPERLRSKLLFRKSVCLSSLGRKAEALTALRACPVSDPAIAAAVAKERHKFRVPVPIESVAELPAELQEQVALPSQQEPRPAESPSLPLEPGFATPPRPLTYNGILQATKSMSKQAGEFWKTVDPAEVCAALKTAGIEPEMLDFFAQFALHDESHGKKLLAAASKCPRYDFAKIMATAPAGIILP